MFQTTARGDVAIVTMTHGKANALDSEFCDALAVEFNELRTVESTRRRPDRAGKHLLRRRQSAARA